VYIARHQGLCVVVRGPWLFKLRVLQISHLDSITHLDLCHTHLDLDHADFDLVVANCDFCLLIDLDHLVIIIFDLCSLWLICLSACLNLF
jgi:hypothetical protein